MLGSLCTRLPHLPTFPFVGSHTPRWGRDPPGRVRGNLGQLTQIFTRSSTSSSSSAASDFRRCMCLRTPSKRTKLIHIQEEENQSTTGRGSKALMVYIPARDVPIFIDLLKRINFATSNKWSQSIEIISIDFNSNLVRLTFGGFWDKTWTF